MSRELDIGTKRHTRIIVTDEPGPGGACYEYFIFPCEKIKDDSNEISEWIPAPFVHIHFQKGPMKESEPNGIFMEDLIAICIDRLEGFQTGDYPHTCNDMALTSLKQVLSYLNIRTADRIERGVDGKSEK